VTISINSNLQSTVAIRRLNQADQNLTRSLNQLSSGSRINSAADDAAGLAIALALRATTRIASIAIRNGNDGISLIAVADGALNEIGQVLTRMAELAEQSANGTLRNKQRSALEFEFQALASEIDRIAVTTELNGISLVSGHHAVSFQIGFDSRSTSQITFLTALSGGTLDDLSLALNSRLLYSLNGATEQEAIRASLTTLDAVMAAIQNVSEKRGNLGAINNRLETAVQNLAVSRENFSAAESRIRDVDVATASADLVRNQILQKTAAAVLGQANQQPYLVLKLLT
jgi:flagellin